MILQLPLIHHTLSAFSRSVMGAVSALLVSTAAWAQTPRADGSAGNATATVSSSTHASDREASLISRSESPAAALLQAISTQSSQLSMGRRIAGQALGPSSGAQTTQVVIGQSQVGFITMIPLQQQVPGIATIAPGIGGTAVMIHLFIPATQRDEVFLLFVPDSPPTVARPLLTFFHAYSFSHREIESFTSFLTEADNRDWFVISPIQNAGIGLGLVNYGSADSQLHVEAVLDLVLTRYAIDRDRLYGAGFSMGGGGALSYAARHRDARQGAFAAVVNHTGTVTLPNVYQNVGVATQIEMIALFGGSPIDVPFEYSRSSLIDDVVLLPDAPHMAVNLESVPVLSVYEVSDTNQYLIDQTIQLDVYMSTLPAARHTLMPLMAPNTCPSSNHCWSTADETFVCDWLEQSTLDRNPSSGVVLADRDARWHLFDVTQDLPGKFTRFSYTVDLTANRITISETENLLAIGLDPEALGLDPTMLMDIRMESVDGTEDGLMIRGIGSAPLLVLRNGAQVQQSCTPAAGSNAWCFDPLVPAVTLRENGPGIARWQILP